MKKTKDNLEFVLKTIQKVSFNRHKFCFCWVNAQVSGLSKWLGDQMSPLQSIPPWAIAIVVCLMIATFTECTSNVATATLFLPILASMVCILLIFTMTCMPLVHCHKKMHKTVNKMKNYGKCIYGNACQRSLATMLCYLLEFCNLCSACLTFSNF